MNSEDKNLDKNQIINIKKKINSLHIWLTRNTHPGLQWAAVNTYFSLRRTPPHLFLVKRPSQVDSLTRACQGQSPKLDTSPLTMRPVRARGLTPQAAKTKNVMKWSIIIVKNHPNQSVNKLPLCFIASSTKDV